MIAYKVVRVVSEAPRKYRSVNFGPSSSKIGFSKEYTIGKVTKADPRHIKKGYGLCVFLTPERAKWFAEGYSDVRILECEIRKPHLPKCMYLSTPYLHDLHETKFWEGNWPTETHMTAWVRPIKEVT